MAARRFLYIFAGLIVLAVAGAIAYKAFQPQLWRMAAIPAVTYGTDTRDAQPDYTKLASWIAHPKLPQNPALQTPTGYQPAPFPAVDVFYVSPTTYFTKTHWNAPLADAEANTLQSIVLRHQASPFNAVGTIWSPRYRQATFGAFLAPSPDAAQALNLAYADVLAAFDAFQNQRNPKRAFLLVGHSQGAVHMLRLLKDRVAGRPAQQSMVAAYIIGWPVSVEADLAPLGLPVCQTPGAIGCVISWQSFGAGADLEETTQQYAAIPTLSGMPRTGTHQLCVNPIGFWASTDAADKKRNLGALPFMPMDKPVAALMPQLVGAQCDPSGFLVLQPPPGDPFHEYTMPNENYHTYDINLFWANVRANAEIRVESFLTPR
jgi:Protein of unknown function (DUF3089)